MKRTTKYFLLAAMGMVLLGVLFRWLSGMVNRTSSSPNFDETKTSFSRVIYAGQQPDRPDTLPIHQATITNSALDTYVSAITASGGWQRSPEDTHTYYSEDALLQIVPEEHSITYAYTGYSEADLYQDEVPAKGISRQQAEAASRAFFTEVFHLPVDALSVTSMRFFSSDEMHDEVSPEVARYVIIRYDHNIDGVPLVRAHAGNSVARAVVDQDNRIRVLTFQPIEVKSTGSEWFNSFTVEEAMSNINRNNAFIANANSDVLEPIDLSKITNATLTSGRIEYFAPQPGAQELIPYYRFSGTATNNRGVELSVDIMTPAANRNSPASR